MSGPVIRRPAVESPSVLDSSMERAIKALARFLGGDDPNSQVLGMLNPTEVAAGPVAKAIAALAKRLPNPIKAYHGSPHDFDQFSLSKIGTGEGAQAYGHGLYFAGDEAVARSYRDALSEKEILRQLHMTVMNGERGSPAVQAAMAKIDEIVSRPKDAPPLGSMYEVALHTEPGRLLDWDKRLHQQPEAVRKAVDKVLPRSPGGQNLDMTGAEVWRRASEMDMPGWKNSREGAASMLRELGGLDGIQYLDAGSRGAGQGTRNYVINNADLIEILRQYGIIGAVGGGAAAAAGQGERAD